jgi:hypothetical protein
MVRSANDGGSEVEGGEVLDELIGALCLGHQTTSSAKRFGSFTRTAPLSSLGSR